MVTETIHYPGGRCVELAVLDQKDRLPKKQLVDEVLQILAKDETICRAVYLQLRIKYNNALVV